VTLTLFSCFWAASTLFHIASYGDWQDNQLLMLAALWALVQPRSTVALALLAAVQIGTTVVQSPTIPNHQLFAALVNLTLLGAIAVFVMKGRRIDIDRGQLLATIAPPIRISLLVLYFFAFFHKLNTDWFDPAVSCGTYLYTGLRTRLTFLPESVAAHHSVIWLSLGLEALIPLLLLSRRTRSAGILIGIIFHGLLALHPNHSFYNFSSMLIALFALFATPVIDRLGPAAESRIQTAAAWFAGVFVCCYLLTLSGLTPTPTPRYPFSWLFLIACTSLVAGFVWLLRAEGARADHRGLLRLRHPVLAALPIVVFVNGLTPYLGLKTEDTWAMFSNLRTEGGISNHLVMPPGLQAFDYQDDLILITRSSDEFLHTTGRRRQFLPYFELRRFPDAQIEYRRGDVRHAYDRIADDPTFSPLSVVQAKLLRFRPVTVPKQLCFH
jgi:hypothetical protein